MTAEHDRIHLTAADWVARLREPEVSLEHTLAWQSWMSEDARHAAAFARMEEVSTVLKAMPRPRRPRGWRAGRDRYDASMPLSEWSSPRRSRLAPAIAASALVTIVALTWAMSHNGLSANDIQTAIGENRTVELPDGSNITLGGDTRLTVALSDKARSIELTRGEAFFKVAKNPSRPFKVRAGGATVVAVGTEFNVRRGGDRVVVAVVEGRVIVEPETRILPVALLREFKPKFASVALKAGQQTSAGSGGVEAAVPLPDPAAATAWQSGRLAFRLEPLRYVLEDINRYATKPLAIEDERIGDLRVTGTVLSNNVEGWVGSLESALGLVAIDEPSRIVLQSRMSEQQK